MSDNFNMYDQANQQGNPNIRMPPMLLQPASETTIAATRVEQLADEASISAHSIPHRAYCTTHRIHEYRQVASAASAYGRMFPRMYGPNPLYSNGTFSF